jgi:hypothetical protein
VVVYIKARQGDSSAVRSPDFVQHANTSLLTVVTGQKTGTSRIGGSENNMTHYSEAEYQILLSRGLKGWKKFSDVPDEGLESGLLSKCLIYCKERGYPIFHDRSRGKNQAGWPDLQIYLPGGKAILVELKSAKGSLRKEQEQLARQFMYLKHRYYKVRSYSRFLKIMEEELQGNP